MDIVLVPYVKAEDGYTVTDEAIRNLWRKLVYDKTAKTVFYDGAIFNENQFLDFFKNTSNLPLIALVDAEIAGFAWLNGVGKGFAFGHFAFFKETWGKQTKEIGQRILDYWLSLGDGTPVINTIVGMIPQFNSRAINYVIALGFKEIGEIPKLISSHYEQDRLNVRLLYYQR